MESSVRQRGTNDQSVEAVERRCRAALPPMAVHSGDERTGTSQLSGDETPEATGGADDADLHDSFGATTCSSTLLNDAGLS